MDRQEVFLIHFGIHFGGPKLSLTKTHLIVRCPANTIGPVCLKIGGMPQNGNFDGKNDDWPGDVGIPYGPYDTIECSTLI